MFRQTTLHILSGFAVASFGIGLTGCATAEPSKSPPLLTGWAQAAGEVRIYPDRRDLGELYTKKCISGFYKNLHTMPKRFTNKRVKVYGHYITSTELDTLYYDRGIQVGVENYCGGDKLVVIDRVELW